MHVRAFVGVTVIVALLSSGSTATRVVAQVRSGLSATPVPAAVLANHQSFNASRARRQPVTDLLADSYVEIQWNGGLLTRADAIDHYERTDDVSANASMERWTASFGSVAVISERTGEEGTPYNARRLYVWVRDSPATWRLLVFQRTFMFARTEACTTSRSWPIQDPAGNVRAKEEEMLATRNPALGKTLAAADAMFVNSHGERMNAEQWLRTLDGVPSEIRVLRRLHSGETTVFIGEGVSPATGFPRRFTHIWTNSPAGLQLRFSQTTYQALADFNPDSKVPVVIPQT
jgi:hypothetical protein